VCRGITKGEAYTPKRTQVQDLTKKRNVWGIKDILTSSPGIVQFLESICTPTPWVSTPDLPPTMEQNLTGLL
jgi:hypothetical protein